MKNYKKYGLMVISALLLSSCSQKKQVSGDIMGWTDYMFCNDLMVDIDTSGYGYANEMLRFNFKTKVQREKAKYELESGNWSGKTIYYHEGWSRTIDSIKTRGW